MAISSGLGVSAIKPGVVDSAATRPASPYEGQVIFQKDTDQLLVWNGTAWVIPNKTTQNPDGLELIKTQTIGTGVTSVPVSDVFSATYDHYKILIDVRDSSGTAQITMQLNGITGSVYYGGGSFGSWAVSGQTGFGPPVFTAFYLTANNAANTAAAVQMELFNPFNTTRKYGFASSQAGNGHTLWNQLCNSTASATGFTVSQGGQFMTGGTISVYGYRK